MIERLYVKDNVIFGDTELFFKTGLVVFTGASGSGKSVLIKSILSAFGMADTLGSYAQISLQTTQDEETLSFEHKKVNTKNRFYLNGTQIPKKSLIAKAHDYVAFLHVQNFDDFSPVALMRLLDDFIAKKDTKHHTLLQKAHKVYQDLQTAKKTYKLLEHSFI